MNCAFALTAMILIPAGPTDARRQVHSVDVSDSETFQRALNMAQPGWCIVLAPGRYGGNIHGREVHGTEDRPIVIRAAVPENPPVLEGGGNGMQLSDVSYLEIHDLVIQGAEGNGLNIDDAGTFETPSHHLMIKNLTIRDIGPSGNRDGLKLSGVNDFRIVDCTIERWGDRGSGIDMVGCQRGVIEGCALRHEPAKGDNGVQTKGGTREIVIRRCQFENSGQRAVNLGGSTGMAFFRPEPQGYEAREITVEDCTIIGGQAAVAFVGIDGAVVRHNTIYRPGRFALRILQETRESGFVPSRDGKFTDNLIVFRSDEMVIPINIGDGTAPETFTLARNAWYCLDRPTRSRLHLEIPEQEAIHGQEPRFRDAENGDLRQASDSPLVRYGVRPEGS